MTQEKTDSKSESLQKVLASDLGKLQKRLEHYEDALSKTEGGEEVKFCKEQIAYYRAETSKVRGAVLELHAAAMAELKR